MLAGLFALAMASSTAAALSDEDLVRYAQRFHGSHEWASFPKNGVIGTHHGATVVAEVHCGDICPDYTRLIIHYGVEPGPSCEKAGGVMVHEMIPVAIAVADKAFCVPRVLVGKHLYSAP